MQGEMNTRKKTVNRDKPFVTLQYNLTLCTHTCMSVCVRVYIVCTHIKGMHHHIQLHSVYFFSQHVGGRHRWISSLRIHNKSFMAVRKTYLKKKNRIRHGDRQAEKICKQTYRHLRCYSVIKGGIPSLCATRKAYPRRSEAGTG